MRRNTRKNDYPVPEILDSDETLEALQEIAQSGNTDLIRASVYKGTRSINNQRINEVSNILARIYHNKCAYCENTEHKPEVEHFRPKKDVKDTTHSGYYWLCYEWSNLLPSCRYCNTEGGKGNKFPIMGVRVENPEFSEDRLDHNKCFASNSPLIDERPYLLHPEIDEPEPCFKFSNNGTMIGIDADDRGAKTIEICNLNRDNLLYLRQKEAIDELKNLIGCISKFR